MRVALTLALAGLVTWPAQRAADPVAYLFSYFTGNGEDGLHLAASEDGRRWTPVANGRSLLAPAVGSRLMRDPSIARGPDGAFHLVWTTGWWDRGIGVAHSKDLVTWSDQTFLPVMAHEPAAVNCWAPEVFYDEPTGEFLIVWATTIPGRFPETAGSSEEGNGQRLNHRLYVVTTRDFATYSDTRLFYDDGFSVIDGIIVPVEGRYQLVVKDETRYPVAKKHLRVATAAAARGPYGPASEPFTVDWVEGPTALRTGDTWTVFYDEYTRRRFGAMETVDFRTWSDVSDQIAFPDGARHGTALEVPAEIVKALSRLESAGTARRR